MPKSIHQIISECSNESKLVQPVQVLNGWLYKWKGYVTNLLTGILKLECLPFFGFVIVDSTGFIPCIIADPAQNIAIIMNLYGKEIVLREPLFISETYMLDEKQYNSTHVYIKGCDIHIVNSIPTYCSDTHQNVIFPLPGLMSTHSFEQIKYKIKVLLVSSAILSYDSDVYCFVLAEFLNLDTEDCNKKIWLILKNGQVSWKDLVLPNRTYMLLFPKEVRNDNNFIDRVPFSIFIKKHFVSNFKDMFHHKGLVISHDAIFLPSSSIISIIPSETFQMVKDKWIIATASKKIKKFISVVGTVQGIIYSKSWRSTNCSFCDDSFFPTDHSVESTDCDVEYSWINPWIRDTTDIPADGLCFPNINFSKVPDSKIIGFGIRSGQVSVQVTICDENTGNTCMIFLKDWKQQQYPIGLIDDATICFTNVCAKLSKRGNIYYVTTPLTRFIYLDLKSRNKSSAGHIPTGSMVKFGFPYVNYDDNIKMWGTLDLDAMLVKVSIMARCRYCGSMVIQKKCTNLLCVPSYVLNHKSPYIAYATAHLKLKNVVGMDEVSLYLKNETVKTYLGIPDHVWDHIAVLAAKSELLYLLQDAQTVLANVYDRTELFFYLYCRYFRPKQRFHVLCRRFKDSPNRYFCIDIEEINSGRLSAMYSNFTKRSTA